MFSPINVLYVLHARREAHFLLVIRPLSSSLSLFYSFMILLILFSTFLPITFSQIASFLILSSMHVFQSELLHRRENNNEALSADLALILFGDTKPRIFPNDICVVKMMLRFSGVK